jgi:uncharacterized membrane protein YhaH (DUF805 family)
MFDFSGRTRRKDFWLFNILVNVILFTVVFIISLLRMAFASDSVGEFGSETLFTIIMFICILPCMIAGLSLSVRRLHDVGKSGLYLFVSVIPFIGAIWLFILYLTPGNFGPNEYGEDPKN